MVRKQPSSADTALLAAAGERGAKAAHDLIARADAALYEAKNSGRNRTVISGRDLVPSE